MLIIWPFVVMTLNKCPVMSQIRIIYFILILVQVQKEVFVQPMIPTLDKWSRILLIIVVGPHRVKALLLLSWCGCLQCFHWSWKWSRYFKIWTSWPERYSRRKRWPWGLNVSQICLEFWLKLVWQISLLLLCYWMIRVWDNLNDMENIIAAIVKQKNFF